MSDENEQLYEIQLISDGNGFAALGDPATVDRFSSAAWGHLKIYT